MECPTEGTTQCLPGELPLDEVSPLPTWGGGHEATTHFSSSSVGSCSVLDRSVADSSRAVVSGLLSPTEIRSNERHSQANHKANANDFNSTTDQKEKK